MSNKAAYIRSALILIILSGFLFSSVGCSKSYRPATFVPVSWTDYRIGPMTLPLNDESKLKILSFLAAGGFTPEMKTLTFEKLAEMEKIEAEKLKGSNKKAGRARRGTAPFLWREYTPLLNKLAGDIVIDDIRKDRKASADGKISPIFAQWFKAPMIFQIVDARKSEVELDDVFAMADSRSRFLLDVDVWWIFTYDVGAEQKKVLTLVVQRLPGY